MPISAVALRMSACLGEDMSCRLTRATPYYWRYMNCTGLHNLFATLPLYPNLGPATESSLQQAQLVV